MNDGNAIFLLKNVNAATAPEQELRDLVRHLQNQMNDTYVYLVGEWNNDRRARSTRDGKFVSGEDVKKYLK